MWPVLRDACLLQVTSGASLWAQAREEYLRLVGSMQQKLQAAQYNSSYFRPRAKAGRRLCTPEGWFSCQVSRRVSPGPQPGQGLGELGQPLGASRYRVRDVVSLTSGSQTSVVSELSGGLVRIAWALPGLFSSSMGPENLPS